jgi:hypothetical protein
LWGDGNVPTICRGYRAHGIHRAVGHTPQNIWGAIRITNG